VNKVSRDKNSDAPVARCKPVSTTKSVRFAVNVLALCFLLTVPLQSFGFSFNSVMDDVGSALKSGMKTVEEAVDQVLPKDDKEAEKPAVNRQSEKKTESAAQKAPANPKEAAYKNSKGDGKKGVTKQGSGSTTASVFSSEPIDPASPPATVSSFKAGDRIYGLLKASKTWKQINSSNNYIIVWLYIDGKQKVYKSVGLQRPELLEQDYFVIDIAPDPAKMTNYSDRDIVFPEKDGYKFGPELFTKYLSELSPGEHTFRLEVKAYNEVYAAGEFTVTGDDFTSYTQLLDQIRNSSAGQQVMPRPGKVDQALQDEMAALLKNAGWPDIRRLVIVDKDWWIDRVSGGDSPVKSRHIAAAAAARDADGGFYFCTVTFHQPMLITGDWGKLELTDTSEKTPIPEANIDQ
jgi:hypothetical protein